MITAVAIVLVVIAVVTLWRAIVLLKAARKVLADAREQTEVTLALNTSSVQHHAAERMRDMECAEEMRVELLELQQKVDKILPTRFPLLR